MNKSGLDIKFLKEQMCQNYFSHDF